MATSFTKSTKTAKYQKLVTACSSLIGSCKIASPNECNSTYSNTLLTYKYSNYYRAIDTTKENEIGEQKGYLFPVITDSISKKDYRQGIVKFLLSSGNFMKVGKTTTKLESTSQYCVVAKSGKKGVEYIMTIDNFNKLILIIRSSYAFAILIGPYHYCIHFC